MNAWKSDESRNRIVPTGPSFMGPERCDFALGSGIGNTVFDDTYLMCRFGEIIQGRG
jgi:hypothetical protein